MDPDRRTLESAQRPLRLCFQLLAAAQLIVCSAACGDGPITKPTPPDAGLDSGSSAGSGDGDDSGTTTPPAMSDAGTSVDAGSQASDAGMSGPTQPGSDAGAHCSLASTGTGPLGLAFPYIYFDRSKVLLDGIDFAATMKIAELELQHGGASSVLTIWAIRDQIISVDVATKISALYFQYIDGPGLEMQEGIFGHDFAVWHFSWAMGNIYRLGPPEVKQVMKKAYEYALTQPAKLNAPYGDILKTHLTGDCIYMGDAHDAGRAYARSHIVIPGNPDYLQSFADYKPR